MTTSIYSQHATTFTNVSAYVIAHDGERVATLSFKFPRDGAGRLWCYVHWIGTEMVRGYAGGYGYDKRSAAACAAGRKLPAEAETLARALIAGDGGSDWDSELRKAGFTVWQAV